MANDKVEQKIQELAEKYGFNKTWASVPGAPSSIELVAGIPDSHSAALREMHTWDEEQHRAEIERLWREVYGTPDNVVWGKQKWIDNAAYWKKSFDEMAEFRDSAVLDARIAERQREELRAHFAKPHFMGTPRLAPEGKLSTSQVCVDREWYDQLASLLTHQPAGEEGEVDEVK